MARLTPPASPATPMILLHAKRALALLAGLLLAGVWSVVAAPQKGAPVSAHAAATAAAANRPAQPFDLQGFLDAAVKAGHKRIVIPPGRYAVTPKDRQHLVFRDLHDLDIVATGVEMVCTQTTRALTFTRCRNLTLRGLTVDYDPLPFTQGRITAVSDDKRVLDVALTDGYPAAETVVNAKMEIFAGDTRLLRTPDYAIQDPEVVDARHLRIRKKSSSPQDAERVGDLLVINSEFAPDGSIAHAIVSDACDRLTLEDVTLYASNCFGFLETHCNGTVYRRCRVDRRPAASDPLALAEPRVRSLDADAFHSKFASKGPSLLDCVAQFMGDDALNICGAYHMITERDGATLRVLMNGDPLVAGDPVELVRHDGLRLPDAKLIRVTPDGRINAAERAFLMKQRMDEGLRTRWTPDAFRVTLNTVPEVGIGAVIASTRRMGNGFRVEGCRFGYNRSRGILIKASDGAILNNTLVGSWGEAIKVSPEYWWLESGSSSDVTIRGNHIADCRTVALAVYAHGGAGDLAPSGAHRNITITGNTIRDCPLPNIAVTSTVGLRIEDNTMILPQPPRDAGWTVDYLQLDRKNMKPVMTRFCDTATLRENRTR